jgi:hypothetical protein
VEITRNVVSTRQCILGCEDIENVGVEHTIGRLSCSQANNMPVFIFFHVDIIILQVFMNMQMFQKFVHLVDKSYLGKIKKKFFSTVPGKRNINKKARYIW